MNVQENIGAIKELLKKMPEDMPSDIAECIDLLKTTLEVRRCRECGCTDMDCSQCVEKTGEPCCWVEDDLCSACDSSEPEKEGIELTRFKDLQAAANQLIRAE